MSACKNLFIRTPYTDRTLVFQLEDALSLIEFKTKLFEITGIPVEKQKLLISGKFISSCKFETKQIANNSTVEIFLGIGAGKGGFGSLLRNQAIIKKRTTNTDACRDLNGRRVRNVNYEAQLIDHLKKKAEEDRRIKKEIDAFKKKEAMIKHAQYDIKLNQDYKNKIEKWDSEMASSIKKGIDRKNANPDKRISELPLEDISEEVPDFKPPKKKQLQVAVNSENGPANDAHEKFPPVQSPLNNILKEVVRKENRSNTSEMELTDKKETTQDKLEEAGEAGTEINKQFTKPVPSFQERFSDIDLTKFNNEEELESLGTDHLKHELIRLGLKCGGTAKERAKRLMEIKKDPANLFNPKFLASKK